MEEAVVTLARRWYCAEPAHSKTWKKIAVDYASRDESGGVVTPHSVVIFVTGERVYLLLDVPQKM